MVVFLSAVSSAGGTTWPGPSAVFRPDLARELPPPSKHIAIRIVIDATSSMAGFIGRRDGSFPDRLKSLERAAHLFPSDSKTIQCAKFGVTVSPAFPTPCYVAVLQKDFFTLRGNQNKTRIEAVFSMLPANSLTIVVTDLFEDEADLGSLFDNFASQIFKQRLALGIVALRAGFSGTIYDIGLDKGRMRWNKDRPFYALVAGSPGDVAAYFSKLASADLPKRNLVILSDVLLRRPVTWETVRMVGGIGVAADRSYIRVNPGAKRDSPMASFGVLRMQRNDCRLDLAIDDEPVPFGPRIQWDRVRIFTELRRFSLNGASADEVGIENGAISSFLIPPNPPPLVRRENAIHMSNSGIAAQKQPLLLRLAWQRPRIRPFGRVYAECVRLGVIAESADFSDFPFVEEWNGIPERGRSQQFDGSKTQYLSEFFDGLWKTLVQTAHPELGSVYIYFEP